MKEFQNQKSIKIKNKYNILESISFPKEYNISWQKIVRVVNIFRIKFKIETHASRYIRSETQKNRDLKDILLRFQM